MSNKVPQIRFNGYSDAWVQRNLGDITAWTKGQGLPKEDLNEEKSGLEAVHYADLYKFSPVMHEVIHWTNSDDGRVIPNNSLLFPASDVTPVGLARTSTLKLSGVKAGGDVIIGQLDESINSSFMSYQINATSKKILPLITGTTVKHVQAKSLATLSVSVTNMAEQTAIAGLFERIDKLIAANQRKLDLLKEQKKGYLQKMFPKNGAKVPELRFAGFADDWELRKLGEVYNFQYGQFNNNPDNGGQYPIYGANGIIGGYDEYNSENAIVIGHMGAYAGHVLWAEGKHFVTYNGTMGIADKSILNSNFGYYLVVSVNVPKLTAGSGQPFVSYSDLNGIKILIPTIEEQQKIGSFFKQLDNTIALHQRKLDLLKEQKKGLLQKMFV
ncbi:restriction endonuclease subunit S [Weissella cibaria]|uniref:restriction endonuclease subunit S n=1 Tax=Weissella cibaria TaxID=137591 RepID=UPI000FFE164F|nr:restriction endonuclease subunit S [Weissella cibaria]QAT26609.1 restriction endonuclease subunit S [Weissella cibaria]